MKRIFNVVAMFLCCNFAVGEIVFERLSIEDEIAPNYEPYKFVFKFKNNGSKTVKILNVKSSCSCTIPQLDKSIYATNETGQINGTFYGGDKKGVQENEIIVFTDDISQPQIKLTLKIKIKNEVELHPRLVYWRTNEKITPKNAVLTISDPSWKIESVSCNNAKFAVKTSSRGNKHNIAITPLSTNTVLRDTVKIVLKNDNGLSKTLAVHALVK